MNGVRSLFASAHKIAMWVMLKIFIYNLLWLAEYQCKGVVKFSISDLFSGVSLGLSNKSTLWKSWQIVDFMFTFEDFCFLNGLSIKRTSP